MSPNGSDWNLGRTANHALRTIQRAANIASPGETILILPGTYRETVHIRKNGHPDHPITFQAQKPGTVTITNAASDNLLNELSWRPEDNHIYSTNPPWPVSRMMFRDETNLYHAQYGFTLRKFKDLVQRPNAYSAFYYDPDNNQLFVFLANGKTLDNLLISKNLPTHDKFGNNLPVANIWMEANNIILEGLKLELGLGSGILLWNAHDVTVKNCSFYGADYGISSGFKINRAYNIVVENNFYHNYPQYYWFKNWLSWQETYSSGARSSLVGLQDSEIVIRHNLVSHAGDGIQISPQIKGSDQDTPSRAVGADIYENLLIQGTDDAIEFDGLAQNVLFHRNIIYDFFTSLGLSPVLQGPVVIYDNFFMHPHDIKHINHPTHLKLLNPWFKKGGNPDKNTIQNIIIQENVFVGNWLAWWHEAPVKNMQIKNNILAIQRTMTPPLPSGIKLSDNQQINLPLDGYPNPGVSLVWQTKMRRLSSSKWQIAKPGPKWLHYEQHLATQDIPQLLSQNFFRQSAKDAKESIHQNRSKVK